MFISSWLLFFKATRRQFFTGEHTRMKKLLVLALGLGIVLGTVSFAQDTTGTDKKMQKKKKKKTDTTSSYR